MDYIGSRDVNLFFKGMVNLFISTPKFHTFRNHKFSYWSSFIKPTC